MQIKIIEHEHGRGWLVTYLPRHRGTSLHLAYRGLYPCEDFVWSDHGDLKWSQNWIRDWDPGLAGWRPLAALPTARGPSSRT